MTEFTISVFGEAFEMDFCQDGADDWAAAFLDLRSNGKPDRSGRYTVGRVGPEWLDRCFRICCDDDQVGNEVSSDTVAVQILDDIGLRAARAGRALALAGSVLGSGDSSILVVDGAEPGHHSIPDWWSESVVAAELLGDDWGLVSGGVAALFADAADTVALPFWRPFNRSAEAMSQTPSGLVASSALIPASSMGRLLESAPVRAVIVVSPSEGPTSHEPISPATALRHMAVHLVQDGSQPDAPGIHELAEFAERIPAFRLAVDVERRGEVASAVASILAESVRLK